MAEEHKCLKEERFKQLEDKIDRVIKHKSPSEETLKMFSVYQQKLEAYHAIIIDIQKDVKSMKPSYTIIKNAEITASNVKEVAKWILFVVIFITTISASLYELKQWIKK